MARVSTYSITNTAASTSLTGICRFRPCELVRIEGSHTPPAEIIDPYTGSPYLSAATQYFCEGDMVYLNAGAVTERLTAGQGPIAGFCLSNGSSDHGTTAVSVTAGNRIMPVNSRDVYALNCYHGTAASSQLDNVKSYIGNYYNLAQATITEEDGSTTYCTVIDLTAQTLARVVVVGVQRTPETTTATPYVRLLVKFLPTAYVSGTPTYQGLQFDA